MNGRCDTKVKQILDAIEYGTLPPTETEKRLLSIIEHEINKEDAVADMSLVSVAQDLLLELHNSSSKTNEEHERRISQLRQRIEATVANRDNRGYFTRRIVKLVAVAAAVVLLMIGIGSPMRWTWFESWSTPDEQQHVIMGHEITVDMVASAIAENEAEEPIVVSDFSEFEKYLGFDPAIPSMLRNVWVADYGMIRYFSGYISVVAIYKDSTNSEKSITCTINYFTDVEYAYFSFEQSAEGEAVTINTVDIYLSNNIERNSATWYNRNMYAQVVGQISSDEAIELLLELIGAKYE